MLTYMLAVPAAEVARLFRAEWECAYRQPELDTVLWKEYLIEEDFAGGASSTADARKSHLVTAVSRLTIEPRIERNYWALHAIVERVLGPLADCEDEVVNYRELTLDEFEAEFTAPGRKRTRVRLDVETAAARHHFDRWLAEMCARHPAAVSAAAAAD